MVALYAVFIFKFGIRQSAFRIGMANFFMDDTGFNYVS
jgi:hypothetical protein